MTGVVVSSVVIFTAKVIGFFMGLIGRGGSLPGVVALKLDKRILRKLKYPDEVIIVTGTNGKTSVSNMIADVYEAAGRRVVANRKGDNLKRGIVSVLIGGVGLRGKVRADVVVLEVDELSVPGIMEDVRPSLVLVNNLFRDQVDRTGTVENVAKRLEDAFENYDGKLILNGDDPNVARLALNTKAEVKYFGVARHDRSVEECDESSDGKVCPKCGGELVYDFWQYSHVGRFRCGGCDFGKFDVDYLVDEVDIERGKFVYNGVEFGLVNMSLFGVYNAISVIAVARERGLEISLVAKVIEEFTLGNGRMEVFDLGGERTCLLNMIKNATGANEMIKYILRDTGEKEILIILNDGIADGKDVSWIWEAKFDLFTRDDVKRVICAGTRREDIAKRMKEVMSEDKVVVRENLDDAVEELREGVGAAYILASYTAVRDVRVKLKL